MFKIGFLLVAHHNNKTNFLDVILRTVSEI